MKFRHILLGVVVFSVASVYFKGPMTPEQQAAKNKKDVEQKKVVNISQQMIKNVGYVCNNVDKIYDNRDYDGTISVFCDDNLRLYDLVYDVHTERFNIIRK